ncbi:HlyD family efflux transporter periplasmic adaptor subunit [Rhodanobacter glycinis]|uniref:HlyD family efflux transporter periplasmic adaptor subunit n=1 Tax=Rhodanobacter glycinis TaxID=582702 RepID=A0A502C705_9GAMM|nr:efflux RND transporter periplasmic adaptor subunit [Rhodanobacter glycinis]TPG08572.1 HlyD family efflux transporter periplasmic adaptor subunit [Rhodanobacter glycinis]
MNFSIRRALGAFALLCLAPSSVLYAADTFPVTAAQMKALGITVQRLDRPVDIRGPIYPARVVLPLQQEQVISAPMAGLVDQLLVDEHQTIVRGQPLLHLNSPEYGEQQLRALEAASKSRLAQAAVVRERKLFAEGIIPQRRVFEAEAAASDAQARVRQASGALRLAGVDGAAIAQLIQSGVLKDALVLHSKGAGVVVSIEAKPGQRVAAADPLIRVADMSRLWLDIQIPAERANAWARNGQIVVVGRKATAKPLSLGAVVGEGQMLILRAEVTSGADQLRPGEFVQAQVPLAGTRGAWTLPLAAVVRQGGQAYVFVRTAQGFVAQPVEVVASSGPSVSVAGPLKAGDQIAISSVIALKAAWLGESGGE